MRRQLVFNQQVFAMNELVEFFKKAPPDDRDSVFQEVQAFWMNRLTNADLNEKFEAVTQSNLTVALNQRRGIMVFCPYYIETTGSHVDSMLICKFDMQLASQADGKPNWSLWKGDLAMGGQVEVQTYLDTKRDVIEIEYDVIVLTNGSGDLPLEQPEES